MHMGRMVVIVVFVVIQHPSSLPQVYQGYFINGVITIITKIVSTAILTNGRYYSETCL